MTLKSYEGRTYGKWILAGEHSVLRGSPALAFPLLSRSLHLAYQPSDNPSQVRFGGSYGSELQLLFLGVLERALETLGRPVAAFTGDFSIHSDLPVGAGLGASAALCAGIGRWCEYQGYVPASNVYEFSRQLENLFHGESSGVDIAVSISGHGVRFVRGQKIATIQPAWNPKLYLSYSGSRGVTSECVGKVNDLIRSDMALGERIDQQMKESVRLCERALSVDEASGTPLLSQGINLASQCFEQWGLVTGGLQTHLELLRKSGAIAVKPTGSGGGGYALSLWTAPPPKEVAATLIPLLGASGFQS